MSKPAPKVSVFPKCYFDELYTGRMDYGGWVRQAATLGAHREAAQQYERALRYADDKRMRAEFLTARGAECSLLDHWQDAVDVLGLRA